jgi:hypothetical protein
MQCVCKRAVGEVDRTLARSSDARVRVCTLRDGRNQPRFFSPTPRDLLNPEQAESVCADGATGFDSLPCFSSSLSYSYSSDSLLGPPILYITSSGGSAGRIDHYTSHKDDFRRISFHPIGRARGGGRFNCVDHGRYRRRPTTIQTRIAVVAKATSLGTTRSDLHGIVRNLK